MIGYRSAISRVSHDEYHPLDRCAAHNGCEIKWSLQRFGEFV